LWLSARKRFKLELELGLESEVDGPRGEDEKADTGRGFVSFLRARWEGCVEDTERSDIDVGLETTW